MTKLIPTLIPTIAWRELRSLLHTAVGWLVIMGFVFVGGVFWIASVEHFVTVGHGEAYNPYGPPNLNLTEHLIAPWFGNLVVILLLVVPAVSMRAFADEYRLHTMSLLQTSPVTWTEVVLGKYLGVMGLLSLMIAATATLPLSLWIWASPDPGIVLGGLLALWLVSAAVSAIGLLASSCTESPLVALTLTFAVVVALWIVGWVDPDPTSVPSQISLSTHTAELLRGALHLSDVSYFSFLIGWCLFATQQRLLAHRYA
jgi:ABC-2 type transport system permease protein